MVRRQQQSIASKLTPTVANSAPLLTVDFLSVFAPEDTKVVQLLFSYVDLVLRGERFRERTSSFRHFRGAKVPLRDPTGFQVSLLRENERGRSFSEPITRLLYCHVETSGQSRQGHVTRHWLYENFAS